MQYTYGTAGTAGSAACCRRAAIKFSDSSGSHSVKKSDNKRSLRPGRRRRMPAAGRRSQMHSTAVPHAEATRETLLSLTSRACLIDQKANRGFFSERGLKSGIKCLSLSAFMTFIFGQSNTPPSNRLTSNCSRSVIVHAVHIRYRGHCGQCGLLPARSHQVFGLIW